LAIEPLTMTRLLNTKENWDNRKYCQGEKKFSHGHSTSQPQKWADWMSTQDLLANHLVVGMYE